MKRFHRSAAPAGATPVERQNYLNVQIDAIGIGLASAAAPFLPVFLARLGASHFQVGLLTAMPAITGFLLAIIIGRFLQRCRNIVQCPFVTAPPLYRWPKALLTWRR
jgi:hypothetical protein